MHPKATDLHKRGMPLAACSALPCTDGRNNAPIIGSFIADVHVILALVGAGTSYRTQGEFWAPVCLPAFNDTGVRCGAVLCCAGVDWARLGCPGVASALSPG
jgi:hypothetical protein